MRRTIQVVISDMHAGASVALMNPEVVLQEEDEGGNIVDYNPKMTPTQEYLWEFWQQCIRDVMRIANGDEVAIWMNGDECQGVKHHALLVSDRPSNQIIIAAANMAPWLDYDNVKILRVIVGTEAHTMLSGTSAYLVQQMLAARYPNKDIKTMYHNLVTYNGLVSDFAHHGPPPGARGWLRGNIARYMLRDLMTREIMHGNKPPDIYWRGHYHTPVFEYLETGDYASRLYVTPSWTFVGDHARQATRSEYEITHGLVALEIVDGKITGEHRMYKTAEIRTKEVL